jgi:nucleoside-diphosphate-sugar epimerase
MGPWAPLSTEVPCQPCYVQEEKALAGTARACDNVTRGLLPFARPMPMLPIVRARLLRGFSFATLGPNEARFLYDIGVASFGCLAAVAFDVVFGTRPTGSLLVSVALPLLFAAGGIALGIYGRFKLSTALTKATVLCGAAVIAVAGAWSIGVPRPIIVLWTLLTLPPVVIARLLLTLPYSQHRRLSTLVVHRHGPVVVIGGAGYIGSETVDLLLQRGHKVRVLDRLMYGHEPIVSFVGHPNFELIEGDVTDIAKLSQALRNASAVVHLAGLVGDPACAVDPEFTRHTNIIATRMAKEVAQGLGTHRFVFASSCSVYGMSDVEVGESAALNPVSLYAQTKIDSEIELLATVRDDFFVTILRFATVFGHSHRPRFDLVANLFTAQAMVNGEITVIGPHQWRPFVHVRDLARAIVLVLEAEPARVQSQIFNVGDSHLNMTIGQLGELVHRIVSERRSVRLSVTDSRQDRRNYAVSFDKIRRELGFEAQNTIEMGIREMAEHFAQGSYRDFRDPAYSNVATTKQVLHEFYDSAELSRLYGPLSVK